MEFIKMSVNTLNEVLAYLGKRPYEEVYQHVTKIQAEAQAFLQSAKEEAEKLESEARAKVLGSTAPAPDFPPVQQDEIKAQDPQPTNVVDTSADQSAPVPQEAIPVPAQAAVPAQ